MTQPGTTNWNCPECGNQLSVKANTGYYDCRYCGAVFKLRWRGGQITDFLTLKNISNLEEEGNADQFKLELDQRRMELQQLNSEIRKIEMSKSGERIKVLSLFAIVCVAIYFLFRITVDGVRVYGDLNDTDFYVAVGAGIAFVIFALNSIFKNSMVRKVNKLHSRRDELEEVVTSGEASYQLYQRDQQAEMSHSEPVAEMPPIAPETEEESDQTGSAAGENILKSFTDRIKERRRQKKTSE